MPLAAPICRANITPAACDGAEALLHQQHRQPVDQHIDHQQGEEITQPQQQRSGGLARRKQGAQRRAGLRALDNACDSGSQRISNGISSSGTTPPIQKLSARPRRDRKSPALPPARRQWVRRSTSGSPPGRGNVSQRLPRFRQSGSAMPPRARRR